MTGKTYFFLLTLFNFTNDDDSVCDVEVGSIEGDGPISTEILSFLLDGGLDFRDVVGSRVGDGWLDSEAWHLALVSVTYGETGERLCVKGDFDSLETIYGWACELEAICLEPRPGLITLPEPATPTPSLWVPVMELAEEEIPF